MTSCALCGRPEGPATLAEAGWVSPEVESRVASAHPGWTRSQGGCPSCLQQALLTILLERGDAALHHSIQAVWPVDPEAAFGAIPTPLRLHADPRFTGRDVTIAAVDSGFYPHPDLIRPSNRIRAWVDASRAPVEARLFGPEEAPRWPGWDSREGRQWHGLMTTTAAVGNGFLGRGLYRSLAPDASVVLVRVSEPSGRIGNDAIARALTWLLDHRSELGLRVVNLSLGGDPVSPLAGNPVDEAVAALVRDGVVVVVAAGNDGRRQLVPPGTAPSALTIGGIDDRNTFDHAELELWHSNYGETVGQVPKPELVAPSLFVVAPVLPGTEVEREAKALFARRAAGDLSVEPRLSELKLVTPHYQHVEGTSFAAPLVTSVVATMLEANPQLTPERVRAILMSTAEPVPAAPPERQGAGVVVAGRAVTRALADLHGRSEEDARSPILGPAAVHFVLHDRNARDVRVFGSWNQWQGPGLRAFPKAPGLWRAVLPRPSAGSYTYKFLVDGERWLTDAANPARSSDGWGGYNSLFFVPG